MSDKKTQKKPQKKNSGHKMKCRTCQFYDNEMDYCTERDIENCSKTQINFSKCEDFLIQDRLVMF